jgi:hypothetical protein
MPNGQDNKTVYTFFLIYGLWFRAFSVTQNTELDATINCKIVIALSYRLCPKCFGHYYAHHQESVKMPLQRLQRHFDGLLIIGKMMPETFWAESVRQSNNNFTIDCCI